MKYDFKQTYKLPKDHNYIEINHRIFATNVKFSLNKKWSTAVAITGTALSQECRFPFNIHEKNRFLFIMLMKWKVSRLAPSLSCWNIELRFLFTTFMKRKVSRLSSLLEHRTLFPIHNVNEKIGLNTRSIISLLEHRTSFHIHNINESKGLPYLFLLNLLECVSSDSLI